MSRIITAALLAAFAVTGTISAQTPAPTNQESKDKAEAKTLTIEDVGAMLEAMGYTPRPGKDKDGKLVGYYVELTRGGNTVTAYLSMGGPNIWIDTNFAVYNEKNPASVTLLLGLMAEHDRLWPAYLNFYPKTKVMQLAQPVIGPNITPAALRKGLDSFMDKWVIARDAYYKARAIEKEEAEEKKAPEKKETKEKSNEK